MTKTMITKTIGTILTTMLILLGGRGGICLAAPPQIADVPAGHWAYQAVTDLVARGYLGLYPDKTFRGDQPVDRYTLAVVVARILGDAVAGKNGISGADAALLRKLTAEFRQELVALASRSKELEEALSQYERDRVALGADMAEWRDETGQARAQLAEALREIVQLRTEITELGNSLSVLAEQSKTRDEEHAEAIAELQGQLAGLNTRTTDLEKQLDIWKYIAAGLAFLLVI